MRVDFGSKEKQKEFFRIAKPLYKTWKQFYRIIEKLSPIKFSLRAFTNWYKAAGLPSIEVVNAICKARSIDINRFRFEIKPENWGVIKGGRKKYEIYGCNLTQEQRLIGARKGMKSLRQKFKPWEWRKISSLAGSISAKSRNNFRKKVIGPKGERMFNILEKEVAEILYKLNLDYEYERILRINDRFLIPDFMISSSIIIECTYWGFVNDKSEVLRERFNRILKSTPIDRVVLITNDRLRKDYEQKLGKMIDVITPRELPEWFITQS